jgi:hypothetical protein
MTGLKKEIDAFFKKQKKEYGVKRNEQAVSLFLRGYSEAQVGKALGFHHKTAHACKFSHTKEGNKRIELTNYIKGGSKDFMVLIGKLNQYVGIPVHTKRAKIEKKRIKREAQATK